MALRVKNIVLQSNGLSFVKEIKGIEFITKAIPYHWAILKPKAFLIAIKVAKRSLEEDMLPLHLFEGYSGQ